MKKPPHIETYLNLEKLGNAVIYFNENTHKCYRIKLMKLLYLLDFIHFKQTGASVTGSHYKAMENGPFNQDLVNEISTKESELTKYCEEDYLPDPEYSSYIYYPQKKFNPDVFTRRELRIMRELVEKYQDSDSKEMIEATHDFGGEKSPWKLTWENKRTNADPIDYGLILDPFSDDYEEIIENIKDQEDIIRAFYQ